MSTRFWAFPTRNIPLSFIPPIHREAGLGPARFLIGDVVLAGALALAGGSRATVVSVAVAFAVVPGCVFAPSVASRAGGAAPSPACVPRWLVVALAFGALDLVSAAISDVPAPASRGVCPALAETSCPD